MYIDFQQDSSSAAATQPRSLPSTTTCSHEQLSALEWSVVALARRDRLSTLRAPGRIAIAMGGVFGASHSPRLACARLEALRQIAVLSWHRGFAVRASEVAAFTDAGFTLHQYELLVSSISRARAASAKNMRT